MLGIPTSEKHRQADEKDADARIDDEIVHIQLLFYAPRLKVTA